MFLSISPIPNSISIIYSNSPNLPKIPKISPPRNFTAHLRKEKKKVSLHFEANADPPLTPPPRGGGWNVSIGKNRWVPCYLLLRFLGQGRDRWGATVDRGIGGLPSLHPGEISYLRRTVCAEERAAYTYLHPPRRGPDTTL